MLLIIAKFQIFSSWIRHLIGFEFFIWTFTRFYSYLLVWDIILQIANSCQKEPNNLGIWLRLTKTWNNQIFKWRKANSNNIDVINVIILIICLEVIIFGDFWWFFYCQLYTSIFFWYNSWIIAKKKLFKNSGKLL